MAHNGSSFLICVPRGSRQPERFRTVGRAVVRIAEMLGAEIEISQKRHLLSVWVYYKNDGKEWRPVYCDWGKDWRENDVFASIKGEIYPFLPHHVLQNAVVR
ncbi:MAG: hypothetical protein PVF15_06855 [Candidatus Bathyarchaeota archaeon]|jgi:hypothetical protein